MNKCKKSKTLSISENDKRLCFKEKINLNSINELLALINQEKINPKEIRSLVIPNNNISDLKGIEAFTNLVELNLINNKISNITFNDVQFFNNCINNFENGYSFCTYDKNFYATFILLLSGNKNLNISFIKDVIIPQNIDVKYSYRFQSINKEINKLIKIYNKSEYSVKLQNEYNSFESYLKEKIISQDSYSSELHNSNWLGVSYREFVTDINPFEHNLNDFKTIFDFDIAQFYFREPHDDENQRFFRGLKIDLYYKSIISPDSLEVIKYLEKEHNLDFNYWKNLIKKENTFESKSSQSGCMLFFFFTILIFFLII